MTKSEIFSAAHATAKEITNTLGGNYNANFSLALKEVYASLNKKWDLSEDWGDRWEDALNRIEAGAEFNGKVYTARKGKKAYSLLVYLDGEAVSIGWEYKEDTQAAKQRFLANVANVANTDQKATWSVHDTNSVAYVLSGMNGE